MIQKELAPGRLARKSFDETIAQMRQLEVELHLWKNSIPSLIRPGTSIQPTELPPGVNVNLVIYLHFCYYGSLISIHCPFAYPWMKDRFNLCWNDAVMNQICLSTNTVVDAARNIALTTKYVHIDCSSPTWHVTCNSLPLYSAQLY